MPATEPKAWVAEFLVFGIKQAWACVFGAALLAPIIGAGLWYPADAALARNDFLTIGAVVTQIIMVVARLETLRELRVIILFHIVGTGTEIFKTSVGSYMVRVFRLFDLAFVPYQPRWVTAIAAALIYVNFFSHHFIYNFRWILLAAVAVVWLRSVMHFRIFRVTGRMPWRTQIRWMGGGWSRPRN